MLHHIAAFALVLCVGVSFASLPPTPVVLNAPFTPFHDDSTRSVNTDPIAKLAVFAKAQGVNTIWVDGGLGQFDTLSIDERKAVAEAWITEGHRQGLYIIVHVGTSGIISQSIDLVKHAVEHGADAIASVPPFYEPGAIHTAADLVPYFKPIVEAAPHLPFFYYHIPGSTHVNIKMLDFFTVFSTAIPNLGGVKYVSSDLQDWMQTYDKFADKYTMMFAPEPKLAALPLGGTNVILAEDFFAPTWLRMYQKYMKGDVKAAQQEQLWKFGVASVFSSYGGGAAERYVYRHIFNSSVGLGPARWPAKPLTESEYDSMVSDLEQHGFFKQLNPVSFAS